ncbi:tyrosine-type recombinase/integrase [Actinocrinis puniceicyclus]|uniref:Tyrosine-type recombinase/integrase n=1 Tax=Actinocrinis puniceicyclus TaxID=977794 RepID=A0A8J7WK81_9ACTN|nr:tyrosine-type recombinase/integrase [Actinocrinis puniceicyclus]MBS2963823.1 tyrosine-type recombinase/integrase [Actinocrinis puniceicyclus]
MSPWGDRAEEYLWLRRALGHELAEANRLLPRFVAYLDACGATSITIEAALAWAVQPEVGADSKVRARRMTVVRGFARHMAGIDPDTQIPPTGLVPYRQRWRPPFIYTDSDIQALMQQTARTIPTAARAATYRTVIGLLAATGMRIGEALRLERSDVDWDDRVITIRASKFAKSRELPVSCSVIEALAAYAGERDQLLPRVQTRTFFMSTTGTPVIYADFGATFRTLVRDSGVGRDSSTRPRTHDLRHIVSA